MGDAPCAGLGVDPVGGFGVLGVGVFGGWGVFLVVPFVVVGGVGREPGWVGSLVLLTLPICVVDHAVVCVLGVGLPFVSPVRTPLGTHEIGGILRERAVVTP